MTAVLVSGFSPALILPLLVWVLIFIAVTWSIARRVGLASEKISDSRSQLTGRIVDAYTNIESVKLFARHKQEEVYALRALRIQRNRLQRFMRLITHMQIQQAILNGVLLIGLVGVGLWSWTAGTMSVGEVAAVTGLAMRLNGMTGWIMWITVRIFEQKGTLEEGLRSLSHEPAIVDVPAAPALVFKRGEITFEGVTHHYGRGSGGLDSLDLTIAPGERVGIVGPSGAGKSTLIGLLLRYRDPESGRILIDGQDITHVAQESLRETIGMVTQDSSLLHRSIEQNLRYGRPDASEADVREALELASAEGFVPHLEDTYGNTGMGAFVGERGVKLSGGQRQRIAIARVLLKNAPIMILDEATSALDSEVEVAIQRSLARVMRGKTVIAIAHRLSTIAQMDRIIVLDKGRIVEQGPHDVLRDQNGLYARLWSHQSGGFLTD